MEGDYGEKSLDKMYQSYKTMDKLAGQTTSLSGKWDFPHCVFKLCSSPYLVLNVYSYNYLSSFQETRVGLWFS